MAKILPFAPTDGTLQRRIQRECQEHEREMIKRAAWMMKLTELAGFQDEEDWESYLNGDYEI